MINNFTICGRLGDTPELMESASGTQYTEFSVCVNQRIKKNDEWTDVPHWFNVTMFRGSKYFCENATKGDLVTVSGILKQNKWTDKNGNKKSRIELIADDVMFATRKKESKPYDEGIPF